jgi:16S rRNA (adenine1518-N6/adenine1519-N6)-dimethyltransferase
MYNLWDIEEVKKILSAHGFMLSKSLGQNFIINPEICPRMVREAEITQEDCVIEIGPGIGVLTSELCKSAKKVVAVEVDKRLPEVLDDTLKEYKNVEIFRGDAMRMNLGEFIEEQFSDEKSIKLCANLPYYITSPLIMKLLSEKLPLKSITVMVQKEAGERICAQVGSKLSGALTASVNYYAQAQELFEVKKENFLPQPKVESEVISLIPRSKPAVEVKNEKIFFSLIKSAFAQRRKSAVNSISAGMGIPKSRVSDILSELGYDLSVRAEKFTLDDFAKIAERIDF